MLKTFYPHILDALHAILEDEKRPDAVTDTNGILSSITTFRFLIILVVVLRCMAYIKPLTVALQGIINKKSLILLL